MPRFTSIIAVSLLISAGLGLGLGAPPVSAQSPPSSAPVVLDGFGRSAEGGLGVADVGGAWTTQGRAERFSVSSGAANFDVNRAGSGLGSYLGSVALPSSDVLVDVSLDKRASGGGTYVSVVGRRVMSPTVAEYRVKVRYLSDQTVQMFLVRRFGGVETTVASLGTVPGLSASPGEALRVRLQVEGASPTQLRAKVWNAAQAEPASWLLSAADATDGFQAAGGVGFVTYLSSSTTDAPMVVSFDNLSVTDMSAPTPPAPTTTTTVAPTTTQATTTTVAPTTTTTTVPPVPVGGGVSGLAGTVVGSRAYAVPSGALVVSSSGSDAGAGTVGSPLRSVSRAVALASSGSTIVVRGGEYFESVTVPSSKRLTIQAWPNEAVWFDGSTRVDGWVASGGVWRKDGWTTEFDASPTYTRGAADSSQEFWGFINAENPMAAHPDQIWIDGVSLDQVGSRSQVRSGTFFHDRGANRLYVGSNPSGKEVRASALVKAFEVRSSNSVLRGIGIRRYAPSVPDLGTVTLERPGIVMEHVAVLDSATTGISAVASGITLRNVHVARSGMLGVHGNHADGLVLDGVLSEDNNTEGFNTAPVSGGAKVTRARDITVRGSVFRDNRGPGLWMDESVYDIEITGSEMRDNQGHGASIEISARAVFADNVVAGNSGHGIKVNNTSDVRIWNNTFVGNGRSINLVQDNRRHGPSAAGRDPRYPNDPTMTWLLGPVEVFNNVIANPQSGNCLLCVEDYSRQRSAGQIGVVANSNVYNRSSSSSPQWVVVWSRGAGNPAVFTDVSGFESATGQERNGSLITGSPVVDAAGQPTAAMPSNSSARPLPTDIANLTNQAAGTRHLGAW